MKKSLMMTLVLVVLAGSALAETVKIECIGSVEYSQVNQGVFADVNSGDAVYATFNVDSDNWVASPGGFGVRGYVVDQSSFQLTIGSVGPVALVNPQPDDAVTYFSIRNADPVADGFFIANQVDWDNLLPSLNVPGGLDPWFSFRWTIGYTEDTFSSLDILDCLGTYDYTGLTSFYTVISDAFADPIGFEPMQTIISTESVATEPASLGAVKALYR